MGFGLDFKKLVLVGGFLSLSCCWGMDYNIDNDKIGVSEIFSVDKIDKTKIPSITLKPMDLGKIGLELEIENNKYALTLDPKGEVDKTLLPEEYRDLFLDSKGFSWLIPSQNLYLNSTSWFKEQQFTNKEIAIRINNIDVEKPSNLIFKFIRQEHTQCEIKTGQLFNFDYLKLHGVNLNNEKENSKINILDCEECGVFTGEKLATLNHLIGVNPEQKKLLGGSIKIKQDNAMQTQSPNPYRSCDFFNDSLIPQRLSCSFIGAKVDVKAPVLLSDKKEAFVSSGKLVFIGDHIIEDMISKKNIRVSNL